MKDRLYYMDVSVFEDEDFFRKAFDLQPQYRREKIKRMKYGKDMRLSLGAGFLLSWALLDRGIDSYDVAISKEGKPYILDHPEVHFNLSHSGEKAMCIIGDSPCGCDIERIRDIDLKLSKRFFAPSEDEHIRNAEDPKMEFFRTWTMKESFIKATGEGFKRPLSSFEMVMGDRVHVKGEEEWFFHEPDIYGGYSSCCCTRSSEKPELLELSFE